MWTKSSPKGVQKQSHSCSCQGCKATNHTGTLLNLPKHWNSPWPFRTFRKLPPEPIPAHTGTLRNLPEVASGTYTSTHRNPPGNFWEVASRTFRKLPPEPSGSCLQNLYTSTHWNPPEPSGTFFRNLLLRPAPAHTGAYLGRRPQ